MRTLYLDGPIVVDCCRTRRAPGFALLIAVLLATALLPGTGHAQSSRDVVISEFAWMGTSTSANDEWIELYNNTGSAIDLTGWTLSTADGTPSVALAGTIPVGGHFLLERTDDTTVPDVAADQIYTGALGNEGEDLVLRDDSSALIDQVNCSSGWFAGHNDAKVPMVRVDPLVDGSLASNWILYCTSGSRSG